MSEISNDLLYTTLLAQNAQLAAIKEKVNSIEVQTIKTNGRVTTLETKVSSLQNDKSNQQGIAVFKKKWLGIAGGAVVVFWAIVSVFFNAWVHKLFHK